MAQVWVKVENAICVSGESGDDVSLYAVTLGRVVWWANLLSYGNLKVRQAVITLSSVIALKSNRYALACSM
jgi:hypothetical protein